MVDHNEALAELVLVVTLLLHEVPTSSKGFILSSSQASKISLKPYGIFAELGIPQWFSQRGLACPLLYIVYPCTPPYNQYPTR